MKRNNASEIGAVLDWLKDYTEPQTEASFAPSRYESGASLSTINSERLCLLIFLFALIFIAVISPILCFGSLFNLIQLDGLWYFWMVTLFDLAYLVRLLLRKKDKNCRRHNCRENQTDLIESTCKIYPFPYTDNVRYMGQ